MVINHMRANSHSVIIKNTQHSQQAWTAVNYQKVGDALYTFWRVAACEGCGPGLVGAVPNLACTPVAAGRLVSASSALRAWDSAVPMDG